MKYRNILKNLPSFHAQGSMYISNTGHEFTNILLCFHALGSKPSCNARHQILLDFEGISIVWCPRIKTNVYWWAWIQDVWKISTLKKNKIKAFFGARNLPITGKTCTRKFGVKIVDFWRKCKGYYTRFFSKNWGFWTIRKIHRFYFPL